MNFAHVSFHNMFLTHNMDVVLDFANITPDGGYSLFSCENYYSKHVHCLRRLVHIDLSCTQSQVKILYLRLFYLVF